MIFGVKINRDYTEDFYDGDEYLRFWLDGIYYPGVIQVRMIEKDWPREGFDLDCLTTVELNKEAKEARDVF